MKFYKMMRKAETRESAPLDPQIIRTAKIDRFKRQKEAKLKLEELQKKQLSTTNKHTQLNNKNNENQSMNNNNNNNDEESDDEENVRELRLLRLDIAVRDTLDELALVTQEIPLLQHAQQQQQQQQQQNNENREVTKEDERSHRSDNKPLTATRISVVDGRLVATPLPLSHHNKNTSASTNKENAIPLPVPIASRLQMQAEVFQPGWPQPTLTVEEAAELEMKYRAKSTPSSNKTTQHKEGTEDDNNNTSSVKSDDEDAPDYDTRGVYKKREWDDWKDDNPRGWGNTGNKGYVY
jgi:immunoglobulin-binding protein 1